MFERINVKQLNSHIYLLDDHGEATGYLVVGQEKALVIDTMNGLEDVHAVVQGITKLPVQVVNTHGHCDHIFGNIYFDKAFMNPVDNELALEHMKRPEFLEICKTHGRTMVPFVPLHDGETIDIGGLTFKVIALPGHTPGGICLLLKEDRILFTGDSINHHLWMQLDECLPLDEFLKNLENILYVADEADLILHGHAQDFDDISLYFQLKDGIKDLILTKGEGDETFDYGYKWLTGRCRQHPFGDGNSVICY